MRNFLSNLFICFLSTSVFASDLHSWKTTQGVDVYFKEQNELPIIDMAIVDDFGSRNAPPGHALVMMNTLANGSKYFTKEKIHQFLRDQGIRSNQNLLRNYNILTYRFLSTQETSNILDAVEMTALKPTFPAKEILQEVRSQSTSILDRHVSIPALAVDKILKELFPESPNFHAPLEGSLNSIKSLQHSQILQLYKQAFNRNHLKIILIGNLSQEKAHDISERVASMFSSKSVTLSKETLSQNNTPTHKVVGFDTNQTYFIFASKFPLRYEDSDYPALMLANHILGNGLSSLLMKTLRDDQGLVYGVNSSIAIFDNIGVQLVQGQTQSKNLDGIKADIRKCIDQIVSQKVSSELFEQMKSTLILDLQLKTNNKDQLHDIISFISNGLPANYDQNLISSIQKLKLKDVANAAHKLQAQDFYSVYVQKRK